MKGKAAAAKGATELIKTLSPKVLGIGSGTTVNEFINMIDSSIAKVFFSSSIDTTLNLRKKGILASDPLLVRSIDVYVDGADVINIDKGACIKGGGGALFREKVLFEAAKTRIIIVDSKKLCNSDLCKCYDKVPLDVHQFALGLLIEKLEENNCKFKLRECERGKLPPAVSDGCGVLVDIDCEDFFNCIDKLSSLPGVLAHGLFQLREGDYVVVGEENGSFKVFRM